MAVARGLDGFTIVELCAEVGVSRRTFFNYFASKEDAVLGGDEIVRAEREAAAFSARGSRGWAAVIDDLVDLTVDRVRASEVRAEDVAGFRDALARDPRLLARFIGVSREREARLAGVIAEREGVAADSDNVRVAIQVFATVMRFASDRVVEMSVETDLGSAILGALADLRSVAPPPIAVVTGLGA